MIRALVVEDEPIFRLDLTNRLRTLGFSEIHGTAYAEEAVRYAQINQPDLILMDVRLKGPMSGLEAVTEISREREVPILIMSAYHFEHDELKKTVPGLIGYLSKPVDDNTLRHYCEQFVQH